MAWVRVGSELEVVIHILLCKTKYLIIEGDTEIYDLIQNINNIV